MRRYIHAALFLLSIALGCDKLPINNSPSVADRAAKDNTVVNERDRSNVVKTPIDQNENQKDIDVTANIRKRVVDTKMSVNAQNIKIITQDGKVTLAKTT